MDLKEWFASRKKQKEIEAVKPLAASEDICLLWKQCFQCREILYTSALRENLHVCPKCQYHFRIGAIDRIEQLFDAGTFHELDANLESADPIKFFDTDSYVKR